MYPSDWPKCPSCGEPALDGHLTCGRIECDESGERERARDGRIGCSSCGSYETDGQGVCLGCCTPRGVA